MTSPQPPQAQWYYPPPKKSGAGWVALVLVLTALGVAVSVGLWWFMIGPGAPAQPIATEANTPEPTIQSTETPTPTPTPTPVATLTVPPPRLQPIPTESLQAPERPTVEVFTAWALPVVYEAEAGLEWIGDGSKVDAVLTAENVDSYAEELAHVLTPEAIRKDWEQRSGTFLSDAQFLVKVAKGEPMSRQSTTAEAVKDAQASLAKLKELLEKKPEDSKEPTPTPTPGDADKRDDKD